MELRFSLALPRDVRSIPVVRRVVGDALRGMGVAEGCVDDLLVAVSEACTNVVQHVRTTGGYEVTGHVHAGMGQFKITDGGRGPRPAPEDRGVLSESGRGIRIMRALVDDLDIDSAPDRGTVVHLRKRLTWRDGALIGRLDRDLMHSAG
ncbi:ATP-binding protein [Actinomadura sp. B10D3]|uniref:ATP-binding protein n=1 Tax=Actinomadura sp. B10D3 TaxID=3153557 RepID=UPI00325F0543